MDFVASGGWTPVSTGGTAWRFRARGIAGVVMIGVAADGSRSYEAIHNDSVGNDSTFETTSRRKAAWFAMHGVTKGLPKRPRYPRAPLPDGDQRAQGLSSLGA